MAQIQRHFIVLKRCLFFSDTETKNSLPSGPPWQRTRTDYEKESEQIEHIFGRVEVTAAKHSGSILEKIMAYETRRGGWLMQTHHRQLPAAINRFTRHDN